MSSAPVTVMSTIHELGSGAAKIREHSGMKSTNAKRARGAAEIRKHPGTNSTDAKSAREAFGDAEEKEIPIPLGIDGYSQHMEC